jgi:hypothetical protein
MIHSQCFIRVVSLLGGQAQRAESHPAPIARGYISEKATSRKYYRKVTILLRVDEGHFSGVARPINWGLEQQAGQHLQ